jgi:hydrogenase nickel incorporation protein HypA/HybF
MHELALTQSIVEMVAEHAQGRTVRRVTLEVGKLTCVMPDALRFCFDLVAAGTALDGAMLDIREIEGRARCVTCGEEFIRHTLYTTCSCGALDFARISGEELRIKEYELAFNGAAQVECGAA